MPKIAIIDYGCGNILSLKNALVACGQEPVVVNQPSMLHDFDIVFLPGVGAFQTAHTKLEESGFRKPIIEFVANKNKTLIGICVGMQLLGQTSEEADEGSLGLGIFDFKVQQLKPTDRLRLPNMGWAPVTFSKISYKEFDGDYYFVHSYAVPWSREYTLAKANYGSSQFSAAIFNGVNVFGFQFHPEKSHKLGLALMLSMVKDG